LRLFAASVLGRDLLLTIIFLPSDWFEENLGNARSKKTDLSRGADYNAYQESRSNPRQPQPPEANQNGELTLLVSLRVLLLVV